MPIIPGWATRVAAHALHEVAALPLARVVVRCSHRRDPLARRRGPPARGPGWATRVAAHALHEAAALPLARVVVRCSHRRDPLARRRGPPARGCFRTPEGPGMVRIGKTLLIVIRTFG